MFNSLLSNYLHPVALVQNKCYFSGFDDMMGGPPPGHPMHPGPMGAGYPPHQMMGGPPPPHHPHGGPHPPPPHHAGSPQGFMDDMGMDIEGLMLSSPPYSANYNPGFFDSGMWFGQRIRINKVNKYVCRLAPSCEWSNKLFYVQLTPFSKTCLVWFDVTCQV